MSELLKLAERCEAAAGPDRELSHDVLLACGWSKTQIGHFHGPLYWWSPPSAGYRRGAGFNDDDFRRHDPTASLDAAMSLVPEGWYPKIWKETPDYWRAHLGFENKAIGQNGKAATPALALCAAALRALAAQEPSS